MFCFISMNYLGASKKKKKKKKRVTRRVGNLSQMFNLVCWRGRALATTGIRQVGYVISLKEEHVESESNDKGATFEI